MRKFRNCTFLHSVRSSPSGYTEVKVEGTFKGEHYRYWAVRSSRGLPQCLDSGLPIKHEPISFMRWQGFDPTPSSWDFLSVAAAARWQGLGSTLAISGSLERRILWTLSRPAGVKLPHWVSFCRDDRRLPRFPLGVGYFYWGSPGGPWYDLDSSSSTATWPRRPGSLMVPLTQWVEGDSHVLGARCRRTSDFCVSLVPVHVGPTWVSFKGSQPHNGEGHGPPASRSTVGCKPGHDSPWDTITGTSVKGSEAINPQGWEKGSFRETLHFLWLLILVGIPAVQVTAGYARHTQAYAGRTRVVRRLTGAHAVRGFDSHDFFVGRFLVGFVVDFAVVEEQVKVFSFLDSDERKVFRKACRFFLKAQPKTTRAPTRRLEGPVAHRRTSRRGKFRDRS